MLWRIVLLSVIFAAGFILIFKTVQSHSKSLVPIFVKQTVNDANNNTLEYAVSVVIINWARPDNVKLIIRTLVKFDEVGEIIIFTANSKSMITYYHPKVRQMFNSSMDDKWGVAVRFPVCAHETHYRRVLMQDDDLLLSQDDIQRLMTAPARNNQIICLSRSFGRIQYYTKTKVDFEKQPYLMCLTRALLINRSLCQDFLRFAPLMEPFIRHNKYRSNVQWNGEDIFLNLVQLHMSDSSSPPLFLDHSHHRELSAPHAISLKPGHLQYRYDFLEEATRQLNFSQHPPLVYWEPHRQRMFEQRQKQHTKLKTAV